MNAHETHERWVKREADLLDEIRRLRGELEAVRRDTWRMAAEFVANTPARSCYALADYFEAEFRKRAGLPPEGEAAAMPAGSAEGKAVMDAAKQICCFDILVLLPDDEDPFGEDMSRLDALCEAGCDDATFSSTGRGTLIGAFAREGKPSEAVSSAMEAIEKAIPGARIARIDFTDC